MRGDIGKIFEKQWEQVMNDLTESHLLGWHRFSDTGSAGGMIMQAQPSDYLVALPPGSVTDGLIFLEAKASEKHSRLQKSMIRPAQRGAIHRFRELLGIPYLIAFWDVEGSRIELWDGSTALQNNRSKQPRCVIPDASVGTRLNVGHLACHLIQFFNLPPKAQTLGAYKEVFE